MLTNELDSLVDKYYWLGSKLGVPLYEIRMLENQYMRDGRRLLAEIIDWWLRHQDSDTDDRTLWESIVMTLVEMKENKLAGKIRRKYLEPY